MLNFVEAWTGLHLDRRGVTALEYAIIAGVLGTVLVTVFTGLGTTLTTMFKGIEKSIGVG